jgi:hypothetical protein
VLFAADGNRYSPLEMAQAVEKGTDFGRLLLRVLAHACERMPLGDKERDRRSARPA